MSFWCLITLATLIAGPGDSALLEQREAVLQAASEVSDARKAGARRSEVNRLMASYREAAETLERLERDAAKGGVDGERLKAQAALTQALAEDRAAPESRAALAAWLGDPEARLKALEGALTTAEGMAAGPIRDAILLDVLEQSQALALALRYDAAQAHASTHQLTQRARALERSATPGQGTGAAGAAEAQRLRAEAEGFETQRDAHLARAGRAESLRERAQSPQEPQP